jgi:predicted RNase H-like HicB family nuclease
LPGCVAVAESEAEVRELIREAIELHLDALHEDGESIPAPVTRIGYVEVPDAG